jgi:hypothetical protein
MKENCKACRYYGTTRVREGGLVTEVDNWCHMKNRCAPKNPCKWWRPKEAEGAHK